MALLLAGFLSTAARAGDSGPAPAAGTTVVAGPAVLARVGGEEITVAAFEAELARRSRGLPQQYLEPADRRALLDEMIHEKLLVAAAREAGYESDPEVVAAFERLLASRYESEHLDPALQTSSVADEDVSAFYDENRPLYTLPAKVEAAILRIDLPDGLTKSNEPQCRARAEEALQRAQRLDTTVRGFGPLAIEYSDDQASRYVGGVVGWLEEGRRHRWPAPVVEALYALESPGDVGPLIEAEGALWLVRLVDRRDSSVRPLAAVQDGIRHELLRQEQERERQRFFRKLAALFPVSVDQERLATVPAPTVHDPRTTPPPSIPAGSVPAATAPAAEKENQR